MYKATCKQLPLTIHIVKQRQLCRKSTTVQYKKGQKSYSAGKNYKSVITDNRTRLSRIFPCWNTTTHEIAGLLFILVFFLTSPSTALMIKSSPQHIYSWVYYTWFLFVTDAFPKVLCDALPPTLLAQMAILSFSLSGFVDPRTRTLSHSHTGAHVHTAFLSLDNLSSHI